MRYFQETLLSIIYWSAIDSINKAMCSKRLQICFLLFTCQASKRIRNRPDNICTDPGMCNRWPRNTDQMFVTDGMNPLILYSISFNQSKTDIHSAVWNRAPYIHQQQIMRSFLRPRLTLCVFSGALLSLKVVCFFTSQYFRNFQLFLKLNEEVSLLVLQLLE